MSVSALEEQVRISKVQVGEQHPKYVGSLRRLADLYSKMGSNDKAEPLYQEALRIEKVTWGEKHMRYAASDYHASLNSLADLYSKMGSYDKAEPLYQEALRIGKETWGEKHTGYHASLNSLADLYSKMGSYDKAEPLYQEALRIFKVSLDEKHPDYVGSLRRLADLYSKMGSYDKAEPLYQEALRIRKASCGEKDPNYVDSLYSLADVYSKSGSYDKAEPLYQEALRIRKVNFGEEHPMYAHSLYSLADLYSKMGSYDKAEPLYQEALRIEKVSLGEKDPNFVSSLNRLADLYSKIGRCALARQTADLRSEIGACSQWQQEVASLRADRDRLAGELAEQCGDLAGLRDLFAAEREHWGSRLKVVACVDRDRLAAELAEQRREVATLRTDRDRVAGELAEQRGDLAGLRELIMGRVEALERQRDGLKEQLATAQSFAPSLQEIDVPAVGGRPAEKHVGIACPGIEEDSIDIEPITNGVAVKIREGTSEDDVVIWEHAFVHRGFELSVGDCVLDHGVLKLVLRRVQGAKLKLSRSSPAPLLRIDKETAAAPCDVIPPVASCTQIFRLTPTPSETSMSFVLVDDAADLDAASVAGRSDHVSAASAPAAVPLTQCLMQAARVLCEDGRIVPATDLQRGMKLRALLPGGGDVSLGHTTVRAVRTSVPRESDFVEFTLDHASESVLRVTATHHMLAYSEELGWTGVPASEIWENCKVPILSAEGPEATHSLRAVRSVRKLLDCQQVVEVELESRTDALFVELSDGDFVAVFGSPGYEVRVVHGFLELETLEQGGEAGSSKSDPIHKRKQRYCRILGPPYVQCKDCCRFYFDPRGCKKGSSCTMCHNEAHRAEAIQQQRIRGSRR